MVRVQVGMKVVRVVRTMLVVMGKVVEALSPSVVVLVLLLGRRYGGRSGGGLVGLSGGDGSGGETRK